MIVITATIDLFGACLLVSLTFQPRPPAASMGCLILTTFFDIAYELVSAFGSSRLHLSCVFIFHCPSDRDSAVNTKLNSDFNPPELRS